MPNHITNILRVNAYEHMGAKHEALDELLSLMKSEESDFDFERVIPMPPELKVTSGSVTSNARALFDDNEAASILTYPWANGCKTIAKLRTLLRTQYLEHPEPGFPTLDDFAERVKSNLAKHGSLDWYNWSCAHWGTKWNAYSVVCGKARDGEAVIHFETAWAPPLPVLDALAAKFPSLCFRLIWCDEGNDRQHRVYWEGGKREEDEDDDEDDEEEGKQLLQ